MRKKIMIITIALMMAFTLIPSVSAFVEADAGGLVSDSYTPCTSGNCFYVKLQKNTYFSGMRMSLVDNKGKRVLGSGYIDLVKKGKHMACGNSCTDLQPTKLDLSALQWKNGQTLYRADGNYTKQELAEYASDDTGIHVQKPKKTDAGLPTVSVYALPSMPDIAALGNSAGLENYLVRFFKPNKDAHGVQTATDKQMVIYKALGMSATDVSNMLNTEQIDRYIVVEPLVFLENHRKVGNKTEIAYYYGTITEVYKLYRQRGLRNWYYGVSNRYASSIYVKDKLKSITDNNGTSQRNYATELAGLRSAQRLKFKEEYYLSNVGFSAGLVWLGDFNDNHAYECTIDNKNVRYPLTRDGKPCCAAVEDNLSHYYGSAGTEA